SRRFTFQKTKQVLVEAHAVQLHLALDRKLRQHHISNVPHQINGTLVLAPIVLVSLDASAAFRPYRLGSEVNPHFRDGSIDVLKIRATTGEDLREQETSPRISGPRERGEKNVVRREAAMP